MQDCMCINNTHAQCMQYNNRTLTLASSHTKSGLIILIHYYIPYTNMPSYILYICGMCFVWLSFLYIIMLEHYIIYHIIYIVTICSYDHV